jgi:Fur family peroxide stress response transcriptional regulator
MQEERVKGFVRGLQQAGLRVTSGRLAICHLLAQSTKHPTATYVYERLHTDFPALSLATVYNTLNTLLALGLVGEIGDVGDHQRHYDSNSKLHANLVCSSCHQIRDLEDSDLHVVRRRIAQRSGYQLQRARLVFYGVCPRCVGKRKP